MVSDGEGQGKVTEAPASTSWGVEARVEGYASTGSVLCRIDQASQGLLFSCGLFLSCEVVGCWIERDRPEPERRGAYLCPLGLPLVEMKNRDPLEEPLYWAAGADKSMRSVRAWNSAW